MHALKHRARLIYSLTIYVFQELPADEQTAHYVGNLLINISKEGGERSLTSGAEVGREASWNKPTAQIRVAPLHGNK